MNQVRIADINKAGRCIRNTVGRPIGIERKIGGKWI